MTSITPKKSSNGSNLFIHAKYEHFVAGLSGGVVSTAILHPLDLLKLRLAVNDGMTHTRPQYSGLTNACISIAKTEGVRGFYRGVTPNIVGAGSAWGLYFLFYNTIKGWMRDPNHVDGENQDLGPVKHMAAGVQAGVVTLLILNPIWVVKTRLCLQYANQDAVPPSRQYKGMFDALFKLYRYEGLAGMYRGLVPGLFGTSHGAIQFMVYEELKSRFLKYKELPNNSKLSAIQYIAFAASSKLVAVTVTYPYQVVRARLQDQMQKYNGVFDVVKKTWRFESFRGFYKGLLPNLLRMTPATAITFLVYEEVSRFLLELKLK